MPIYSTGSESANCTSVSGNENWLSNCELESFRFLLTEGYYRNCPQVEGLTTKDLYSAAELGLENSQVYHSRLLKLNEEEKQPEDLRAHARVNFQQARCYEMLGQFDDAHRRLREARARYVDLNDKKSLSQCAQDLAVWSYHQGDVAASENAFKEAIVIRSDIDEPLLCAQSWHNLAFVQLRDGRIKDAFCSYGESRKLVERCLGDPSTAIAVKAKRTLGFILSHLVYAKATIGDSEGAIGDAAQYFDHVSTTKAHKEPLLVYVGVAMALDPSGNRGNPVSASRLRDLAGLDIDSEVWFKFALRESLRALIYHQSESERRPYLGLRMLTLAEYGLKSLRNGEPEKHRILFMNAKGLAVARGWKGEALRYSINAK